jgi:hypothetical protein
MGMGRREGEQMAVQLLGKKGKAAEFHDRLAISQEERIVKVREK